jgi:hypothetical protein
MFFLIWRKGTNIFWIWYVCDKLTLFDLDFIAFFKFIRDFFIKMFANIKKWLTFAALYNKIVNMMLHNNINLSVLHIIRVVVVEANVWERFVCVCVYVIIWYMSLSYLLREAFDLY